MLLRQLQCDQNGHAVSVDSGYTVVQLDAPNARASLNRQFKTTDEIHVHKIIFVEFQYIYKKYKI